MRPAPTSSFFAEAARANRGTPAGLGEDDDGRDAVCETWSNPFDCANEGSVVVIECVEDDARSPSQCGAREVHEQCVGWADMASFCPARSSELKETHFDVSTYQCGGGGVVASSYSAGLDSATHCPLCRCDHPSECVGEDCEACGGVVSRSADAACVPAAWAKLSPADVPVTTLAPAKSPQRAPTKPSAPTAGGKAAPSSSSSTAAPTTLPSGATSAASSTAAILIALIAGGITACAIRQAVVKRRKREALGQGGAQFVDIPNRPVAFTATPVSNPLAGMRPGGRGGYDEIPGSNVELGARGRDVDAYGNESL